MVEKDKVNILLVDDQPAKLLSYEVILAELGENLIKANSGQEALEQLLKKEVAVVLVDVCMPQLDGFELAEMIRQHPRFQKTAIILVSAVLMTDLDRLKGYDSGAVDYVSVPIVPEVLRAKVAVFADLFRKRQELQKLNAELEQRVFDRTKVLEATMANLRQSEERFRLMADNAPVMIWVTEPDGTCSYLSKAWFDFTGQTEKEALGKGWLGALHPEDRTKFEDHFALAHDKRDPFRIEFRLRGQKGEYRWMIDSATPRFDVDGGFLGFIGSIIDIDDRKVVEEERGRLLESERVARNEAERATRLKDEFLATLSHELRTPLNSILGWAQILRRGKAGEAETKKGLETIERNVRLQTQLVDDLFEMNRIMSGKIHLEWATVELYNVIETVVESFRPAAQMRKIEISSAHSEAISIKGDGRRLQQVLSNLISNAIKFTPPGGKIDVTLIRQGDDLEIRVRDTGQGISKTFLPYVFDRFRQGDSSLTRKVGGLGLGLAIVKHLTELHGGSIAVESAGEGKGATFIVRLPTEREVSQESELYAFPYERAGDRRFENQSLKGFSVLAVDDEEDARTLIHRVLEESEANVMTAASGKEALEIVRKKKPDLLVCDISMPGMDGYELIRSIRALDSKHGGEIPAVALTAFARLEDQERVLEAGYQVHLAKPLEPFKLVEVLNQLVKDYGVTAAKNPRRLKRTSASG